MFLAEGGQSRDVDVLDITDLRSEDRHGIGRNLVVWNVDIPALSAFCKEHETRVYLSALPGTFINQM